MDSPVPSCRSSLKNNDAITGSSIGREGSRAGHATNWVDRVGVTIYYW